MSRSIYISAPCGCSAPGILRALEKGERKEALSKGRAATRRPVAATDVGRYVDSRQNSLTEKLHRVLRNRASRVRAKVAKAYEHVAPREAEKLHKAAGDDRWVERLVADLGSEDLGRDLEGELAGAMLAAFRRAAAKGATQVGIDASEITKQLDVKAKAYAARRGAELIKDFATTTEDALRRLIERAVEEGMSTDELADAVEDLGAFGEARAASIARTELATAHVQGNVEGWRESGEVVGKRSMLGDNHDVDDQCDACADAGVVDMDDEFFEDYKFPPYHPNCVCDVEPVLRDAPELYGR